MTKLIFSIALLISMCALLAEAAEAQICTGRCVNASGNPAYDSFCPTIAQNGGGSVACQQYASIGCTWKEAANVVVPGTCENLGTEPAYDEVCRNAGKAQGEQGCEKLESVGCSWQRRSFTCR